MKYWKKLNGDCGTMDDNGYVPDSIEIPKVEYDEYIVLHGPTLEQLEDQRKQNIESEIRKKYTVSDEINFLADVMLGTKTKNDPDIINWRTYVQKIIDKYPKNKS